MQDYVNYFYKKLRQIIAQQQKVRSRALFLLPELPLYSCWVVLYSCCILLYSFCLELSCVLIVLCHVVPSCTRVVLCWLVLLLVLCRVVLVLSRLVLVLCCVGSYCYSCSFLDQIYVLLFYCIIMNTEQTSKNIFTYKLFYSFT